MTPEDRAGAVRRWTRRPFFWGLATMALATALFIGDISGARGQARRYADAYRVEARVEGRSNEGRRIDVVYRHPQTGETVHASTYIWHPSRHTPSGDDVELEVDRSNPAAVVVAGDRLPATANLPYYALWAPFPFVLWLARRHTLRRSRKLVLRESRTYLMHASVSAPPWWARRARLHLFPLDAAPSTRPICTMPLVAPFPRVGTFPVEVKGSPHAYARVVARDQESGEVLWPSGRALRSHGRTSAAIAPVAPATPSLANRWLVGCGAGLLVAGLIVANTETTADEIRERERTVSAEVVASGNRTDGTADLDVTYTWNGARFDGTIGPTRPAGTGDRVDVRIDPETPTRVWAVDDEMPPGASSQTVSSFAIVIGLGLLIAAGVTRYRSRRLHRAPETAPGARRPGLAPEVTWGALSIGGDRLWYGRPLRFPKRRPRLRFEPDALVVVETTGRELALPWDNHERVAGPRATLRWCLSGVPPGPHNASGVDLFVQDAAFPAVRRNIVGGSWGNAAWGEIPALAAYLAATPDARAGLRDRDRLVRLVTELRAGGWSRPHPPGEPLLGDHLDLHLAVTAVVNDRVRHFADRSVRGEPVPPIEQLVDETTARLPSHVRPRLTAAEIRDRVERKLATGQWPFDVLLGVKPG